MGEYCLHGDIHSQTAKNGGRTRTRAGFTVLELLISLLIMMTVSTMMVPVIKLLAALKPERTYYQDEIGVYQLQLELAVNDIIEVRDDTIVYTKQGEEFELHIINGKLISQAGTLDFIHDIDQVWFSVEDDVVYMTYERDEKRFEWPIGYFKP